MCVAAVASWSLILSSVCLCVCVAREPKKKFFFFLSRGPRHVHLCRMRQWLPTRRERGKKNYVYNTPPPEKKFFVCLLSLRGWWRGGGDLLFCGRADVFYRCTINLRFGGGKCRYRFWVWICFGFFYTILKLFWEKKNEFWQLIRKFRCHWFADLFSKLKLFFSSLPNGPPPPIYVCLEKRAAV